MKKMPKISYLNQPQKCKKCGAIIGFVKNRKNKFYPVDLFYDEGGYYFNGCLGNYGNYTPWHTCDKQLISQKEKALLNQIDTVQMDNWIAMYREINCENDKNLITKEEKIFYKQLNICWMFN